MQALPVLAVSHTLFHVDLVTQHLGINVNQFVL